MAGSSFQRHWSGGCTVRPHAARMERSARSAAMRAAIDSGSHPSRTSALSAASVSWCAGSAARSQRSRGSAWRSKSWQGWPWE